MPEYRLSDPGLSTKGLCPRRGQQETALFQPRIRHRRFVWLVPSPNDNFPEVSQHHVLASLALLTWRRQAHPVPCRHLSLFSPRPLRPLQHPRGQPRIPTRRTSSA